MSLSRFFIDRPVFAWVIAIVIMLAGGIAAFSLPVEQYPTIAPPAVSVLAMYPGADAATVQTLRKLLAARGAQQQKPAGDGKPAQPAGFTATP